jgi:RimJ/RimL family protein N-acetyltransferase
MAELMLNADLAVGMGGVTKWECAALGLPVMVLGVAANQRPIIVDMTEAGMVVGYPDASTLSENELAQAIRFAASQPGLLQHLSRQLRQQVDGLGTKRVACAMRSLGVEVRLATTEDTENIFLWRNDTAIRLTSSRQEQIPHSAHVEWMSNTLKDRNKILLVGEDDGHAVGVIRFDIEDEEATTSVYVVPGLAGRGYGTALTLAGERWLKQHRPNITAINAVIRFDNAASKGAFSKAEYSIHRATFRKAIR